MPFPSVVNLLSVCFSTFAFKLFFLFLHQWICMNTEEVNAWKLFFNDHKTEPSWRNNQHKRALLVIFHLIHQLLISICNLYMLMRSSSRCISLEMHQHDALENLHLGRVFTKRRNDVKTAIKRSSCLSDYQQSMKSYTKTSLISYCEVQCLLNLFPDTAYNEPVPQSRTSAVSL